MADLAEVEPTEGEQLAWSRAGIWRALGWLGVVGLLVLVTAMMISYCAAWVVLMASLGLGGLRVKWDAWVPESGQRSGSRGSEGLEGGIGVALPAPEPR